MLDLGQTAGQISMLCGSAFLQYTKWKRNFSRKYGSSALVLWNSTSLRFLNYIWTLYGKLPAKSENELSESKIGDVGKPSLSLSSCQLENWFLTRKGAQKLRLRVNKVSLLKRTFEPEKDEHRTGKYYTMRNSMIVVVTWQRMRRDNDYGTNRKGFGRSW
jgi:hypothetical protein